MQYNEMAQAALKKMAGGNAVILAIETSCDETAAAVVRNGREVLGSSIYSQIPVHREYGGVVPELASRNHVEKLPFVVDEALLQAGMKLEEVDALAVTQG
ncbi:MAG: tRNA (adenosine(37)-N6)-threonylcarbamoyltransferase complex transferase subunit TsaD, partial [Christensenellaceae bacterium]